MYEWVKKKCNAIDSKNKMNELSQISEKKENVYFSM